MVVARGFTLVEVLVATGLLVLIAAFTLPVALTNGPRARAQTAERILLLSPNQARGEARALGRPVALALLPETRADGGSASGLRLSVLRRPDPDSDNPQDLRADPEDIATWPVVGQDFLLPQGTALWDGAIEELEPAQPQGEGDVFEAAFARLADANSAGEPGLSRLDETAGAIVLAWFLSDGSAVGGDEATLLLADGRVVLVRVEPLTGRLVLASPRSDGRANGGAVGDALDEGLEDLPAQGDGLEEAQEDLAEPGASRFRELGFDELEFERRGFEDLGERFEGRSGDRSRSGQDPSDAPADGSSGSGSSQPGLRTTPNPPQPR